MNIARREIFRTRLRLGEYRGEQIVRAHALNRWRNLLSPAEAQQRQGASGVPAPARGEKWRSQHRLLKNRSGRIRMEKMKNVGQGKAVLLAQRNVQAIVSSRGLQLKIKGTAKSLA